MAKKKTIGEDALSAYNDERLVSKHDKKQLAKDALKKDPKDEFFDLIGYTEGSIKDVKITKGSHLTVYTYPDGRTKLEWDDEALMRDVQEALASVASAEAETKPKKTRKKKDA